MTRRRHIAMDQIHSYFTGKMIVILNHIFFFPKSYNPFHFPISLSVKDVYPWIDKIYNATIPFRPSPLTFIIFCRLPVPRPGQVLGLVGTNGIRKSTALKILAGKMKPNLGKFTVSKIEHLFCHPCRSHFKLWTISSNLTGSPKLGWHSKALSWIWTSEILHSPFGRQNDGTSTVVLVGV